MHRVALLILILVSLQMRGQIVPKYTYTPFLYFDSLKVLGYDSASSDSTVIKTLYQGKRGSSAKIDTINGLPAVFLDVGGYEKVWVIPDSLIVTFNSNGWLINGKKEFENEYSSQFYIQKSRNKGLLIAAGEVQPENMNAAKVFTLYSPNLKQKFYYNVELTIDKESIKFDSFRYFKNEDIPLMHRQKSEITFYMPNGVPQFDIMIGDVLDLKEIGLIDVTYKITPDGFKDLTIKGLIDKKIVYVIRKGKNLHGNYGVFINEGEDWYSYSLYNE